MVIESKVKKTRTSYTFNEHIVRFRLGEDNQCTKQAIEPLPQTSSVSNHHISESLVKQELFD